MKVSIRIKGPQGEGKSTLARKFATDLAEDGFFVRLDELDDEYGERFGNEDAKHRAHIVVSNE